MRFVGVLTRRTLLALAVTTAFVACGSGTKAQVSAAASTAPSQGSDWTRFNFDAQRSGVGPASTGIISGNLGSLQSRVVTISGVADSSAVELHAVSVAGRVRDVIFITTTYGKTLAIDPATGATLWQFVPGNIGSYLGSYRITTATPVIDPDRSYLYAASPDGRIHKLAIGNGAEVRSGHWPAQVTFDPSREKIASALNISGNSVVVTTGGYYGDAPTYQGHVALIDRATGVVTNVWNSLCSDRHHLIDPPSSCGASASAIWGRAGAVIEPDTGRILVATGNGPFNGSTNWGDSVLELSPNARRLLHNWTPRNQAQLNSSDTDLGSSAPAVLPVHGYRLAVQGGKDGQLHLLNLNRLNGTRRGAGRRLGGALQNISTPGGAELFSAPAVWTHNGHVFVFVADSSGTAAYVLRLRRHPHLARVWQRENAGTSPVIAGGLLYVYDEQGGRLDVYGPRRGVLLRSLAAAPGHWSSPIVVDGRVILPTGGSTANNASHSQLFIYHLPGQ